MEATNTNLMMLLVAVIGWAFAILITMIAAHRLRRKEELRLRAEKEKEDAYFNESMSGVVVFNERVEAVRINEVAERMGFAALRSEERSPQEMMLPEDEHGQDSRRAGADTTKQLQPLLKLVAAVFSSGQAVKSKEVSLVNVGAEGAKTSWYRVDVQRVTFNGVPHAILTIEEITEEKMTRARLDDALVEVERLDAEIRSSTVAKAQYFAGLSHEFRTPLNGIIGMADLLMGTELTAEQREYAENIRRGSEALLVVMGDVLDMAKIDADKIVLEDETFDLQYCIEEAIRLVMPNAYKKHLEIICQTDGALQSVWVGDIGRIRQILVYLLDNAIRFTERGEIVVSVAGSPLDEARYKLDFAVKDTGIGIPPERQATLLQSAEHVDAVAASRHWGGSGLSLVISRRLCELMGGEMSVESKGIPGQGSVFRFSVIVKNATDIKASAIRVPDTGLEGKRVLIVDDNATSREQLAQLTRIWRMQPTPVASASGAMDWMRSEDVFDIALLDYEMSGMNGLRLAETIRQLPGRGQVRVILLSPLGDRVTGGDRMWIDTCVTKPAFPERLHDAMVSVLSAKEAHRPEDKLQQQADAELAIRHPLRILIAEDNVVNQRVAISILNKLGYHADVASDGYEAVCAVKKKLYDVIMMDIQMPTLDGEQATIRIRKELPQCRQPWIIAMTANVLKGDRERYLADGMNDYIPKPIHPDQLRVALKEIRPLESHGTADAV